MAHAMTIIIPAFNEAKTIAYVVGQALETKYVTQVIVVDDGSIDNSKRALKDFESNERFLYLKHVKNKGKGAAMETGLRAAKTDIVVFLDADLRNITSAKILKIARPVLEDKVDLARGSFKLARGRVTEIAVKPMMKILFPDQTFDQPITGQICGRRSFLLELNLTGRWGVDIGILLDAIEAGQRIVEVDIGKLEHKERPLNEKAEMAMQVLETMVKKAGLIQHKYKVVVFTLDKTLIAGDAPDEVFRKLGLRSEITRLQRQLRNETISFRQFLTRSAKLLRGRSITDIEVAAANVRLAPYAAEVIRALKKRKFKTALVSSNFAPIVTTIATRLGIDDYAAVTLETDRNTILTGRLTNQAKMNWNERELSDVLIKASRRLAQRAGAKLREVVMVANSARVVPIFDKIGLSLAYRPKNKELRANADKTISVLAEVLALVE